MSAADRRRLRDRMVEALGDVGAHVEAHRLAAVSAIEAYESAMHAAAANAPTGSPLGRGGADANEDD